MFEEATVSEPPTYDPMLPDDALGDFRPALPSEIALLPLAGLLAYPTMVTPLAVSHPSSVQLIDEALAAGELVACSTLRTPSRPPQIQAAALFPMGTLAVVHRLLRLPDGTLRVAIEGVDRIQIEEITQHTPYLRARFQIVPEQLGDAQASAALVAEVRMLAQRMLAQLAAPSDDLPAQLASEHDALRLSYLVASHMLFRSPTDERESILSAPTAQAKLQLLRDILSREVGRFAQRAHALAAPPADLAPADGDQLLARVRASAMSAEAKAAASRTLGQIRQGAADPRAAAAYVEGMLALPWGQRAGPPADLGQLRQSLDAAAYGLDEAKALLVDHLALRRGDALPETVPCLVGPPGVGRSHLARALAAALGRPLARVSLAAARSPADLLGGPAGPGLIMAALARAGASDAVLLLEDVDALASAARAEVAQALLAALDAPRSLRDGYYGVAWDLAPALVVASAQVWEHVPPAVAARLEPVALAGYALGEKLAIARRHLLPAQMQAHGLHPDQLRVTDGALRVAVAEYTREPGLRGLDRALGTICRKLAAEVAEGRALAMRLVDEDAARAYLGRQRHTPDELAAAPRPGTVPALLLTPEGGDMLLVEATAMPGGLGFMLTGHAGDAVYEVAQAALSWVRAEAAALGLDAGFFAAHDIHIHIPSGALPSDTPALGLAVAAVLASLARGRPPQARLALAGALTVGGRLLPAPGLRERLLAAQRAGAASVVLPAATAAELAALPAELRGSIRLVAAQRADVALAAALA